MARVCEICGKRPEYGNTVSHSVSSGAASQPAAGTSHPPGQAPPPMGVHPLS